MSYVNLKIKRIAMYLVEIPLIRKATASKGRDRKNIFWLAANDFWVTLAVNLLSLICSEILLICLLNYLLAVYHFV